MSNVDNLITKIMSDSREKAAQITEEAQKEAERIISEAVEEGEKEKNAILVAAREEAQRNKELAITKKNIEMRDQKLAAKQQIINEVFQNASEKLHNLSSDQYVGFLESYLHAIGITGGEEVIVPEKYGSVAQKINGNLKGKLTMRTSGEIDGGFILIKSGMENKNTIEALFDYYRDEIEKIVSDNLF